MIPTSLVKGRRGSVIYWVFSLVHGIFSHADMSAATKNDLCNRALSFLGEPTATPFTGGTTLRDRECAAHYEAARDEVLTHHRWDFATKLFALTLADPQPAHVPADFPFAYHLPDEMLRFQEIIMVDGRRVEFFKILGSHLFLAVNELEGHIAYTASDIEPEEMMPVARECVAYALAIRIAEQLTGNPNKTEQMRAHLASAYQRALTTDSRQTGSRENMDPLLLARQSGSYRSRYYGFNR